MIEHIWTVLCSHVITSRETNNISLIDVMEELALDVGAQSDRKSTDESVVPLPISLVLVSLWSRMEDSRPIVGAGKDILLTPSGKTISENEFKIDLSNHMRMRTMRKLVHLPIPVKESGKYRFRTELLDEENETWKTVSNIPLIINTKVTRPR
ncbi:MAG: hypothetical protein WBH01_04300 [Dehalococcoidia bacterium]